MAAQNSNIIALTWMAQYLNVPPQYFVLFSVLFVLFIIALLLVKGLALWRAASMNLPIWFWAILFINTLGILDIYFLLTHRESHSEQNSMNI